MVLFRHSIICISLLGSLFIATSKVSAAQTKQPVEIDNPAIHVLRQQKKVRYMKQGIKTHKEIIQRTAAKKRSLLTDLENINRQLKKYRFTQDEIRHTIELQEKLIKKNRENLNKIISDKELLEEEVKERLAAYYQMGEIGVLNVIFSNVSLADYLNFNEYFHSVINHDQNLLSRYRNKIIELSETRTKMKQDKESLLAAERKIIEQEGNLLQTKNNRKKLLNDIRTEKTLYLMALKEIEEAADDLTSTIEQLKKEAEQKRVDEEKRNIKEEAEVIELAKSGKKLVKQAGKNNKKGDSVLLAAKKNLPKNAFQKQKGRLQPPAVGKLITFFGKNKSGKFGVTTYENGIDIKIAPGTKIRAIYDGTVVYSNFLRGYGKLIIIDHGDQYYSLVSRVAEIFKKEKEQVKKGEVIAVMSDERGLLNDGLHFELRHGATPIDPLHWLDGSKLRWDKRNKQTG